VSLVTRCPRCATAFRVQPGQLSAQKGQVRCGKCNTVFDGIAALVHPAPPPTRVEPPPQPPPGPIGTEEPLPQFMAEPPRAPRGLWTSLVVLAAFAFLAQATLHYRHELAAAWPPARTALEAVCQPLGCQVRLPRQAKLLSIDSYEVRPDAARSGVIVLHAVIRNRAPFAQEFPSLQLTLTDEANRELVSRSLLPREYLESARARELVARGIGAGAEATLTVHLDAGGTRATGYELVLFYPS
jgi:predicted Zn finger-like uncharacterized protein